MTYIELVAAISAYTENTFPTEQMNTFIKQAEQRIYSSMLFPTSRKTTTLTLTPSSQYLNCPSDFLAVYSMAVIDATGVYAFLLNKDVNFIREAYPTVAATGTPRYYAIFGPQVAGSVPTTELRFILGPTPSAALSAELNYAYYPESIVQGAVITVSTTTVGSGLVNGTYYNVPLTGGAGNSALATVVVSGNVVTSVAITAGGAYYVAGNVLTASVSYIGGAGVTFTVTVASVSNPTGTTWLGDNIDTVLLYGSLVEAYTYMKGEADIIALYDGKYKEALMLAKRLTEGLDRQDAYRNGQARIPVS